MWNIIIEATKVLVNDSREWDCMCPKDIKFDKSVNPIYVSKCLTCGAVRPGDIKCPPL